MKFWRKKGKEVVSEELNTDYANRNLVKSLDANIELLKQIFNDDDTLFIRHFENNQNVPIRCCIAFIEGMVNNELINENLIQPIMQNRMLIKDNDVIGSLQSQIIISSRVEKTKQLILLVKAIVTGNTVLFLDGTAEGLIIYTRGCQYRSITEPESERVVRGPREGFTESIIMNHTMIRRKIESPNLKFKFMTIGVQTHTKVCICYIEGIVNRKILDEVYKRLNGINIDGILDAGYIQELIRDSPFSPLKTIGSTERPDIVVAKLLEGRIALIVDGTPVVLTLPYLFVENFQSNEDYYINFYYSSISRLLRVFGFIITISVPSIYVALVTFHQEAIPTPLLLSISAARQGVPFPTIVEIILLLFTFEIIRETGIRMPSNVGQALSIVGALVLGQASVEAKIVSAPIVIVVSITAISGLIAPRIKGAVIILRLVLLLLSAFIGLYGYVFGIMGVLLHLCDLRSFGVPYMMQYTNLDFKDLKDTVIREPWWYMKFRPKLITVNRVRQVSGGKKL